MQNWLMLANTRIASGRFEDALQDVDRAIAQEPENAMAHCIRGIALKSLDRSAEALNSYWTALSLDPSNIIVVNNMGILQWGSEDQKKRFLIACQNALKATNKNYTLRSLSALIKNCSLEKQRY